MNDRWDKRLGNGWQWKTDPPLVPLPACKVHEFRAWVRNSGFLCGSGGGGPIDWLSCRCFNCGRMGTREVIAGVLGPLSVSDLGAVTAEILPHLQAALLEQGHAPAAPA